MKETKQSIIQRALDHCDNDYRRAYLLIADKVGLYPLNFQKNQKPYGANLPRIDRVLGEPLDPYSKGAWGKGISDEDKTQNHKALGMCYKLAKQGGGKPSYPKSDPKPPVSDPFGDVGCGGCDNGEHCGACECCPPEPSVTTEPPPDEARDYLETLWRAREVIKRENSQSIKGGAIPEVGTRAILDGAKAKLTGIPFAASLASVALDWTPAIRRELKVEDFDWTTLPEPPPEMPDPVNVAKLDVGRHVMFGAVVRQVQARNNVALIGPAGCGKTELSKQVAEFLGLDFAMLPMSGGITRGDLCGTETMAGFKGRQFPHIYANGGLFLADEMDRANPKVLPVLNSALANSEWKNPMTDDPAIQRNPNFAFIACMNTMGVGADRNYSAAERLDGATRDRIATSRIVLDYDRELEQRIFEAILAAGKGE